MKVSIRKLIQHMCATVALRKPISALLVGGGLLCLALAPAQAAGWSYAGLDGPEEWGHLGEANAACLGEQQSPIDLVTTNTAEIEPLALNWDLADLEIVDNGHTIQANIAPGLSTRFGNRRFELLQVHFHAGSEHTFLGKQFPVEAHFVHRSPEGDLLVLGVMIEEGPENQELASIWSGAMDGGYVSAIPLEPASLNDGHVDPVTTHSISPAQQSTGTRLDLANMLPDTTGRFQYMGSLTTPPCSEIVNWVVFSTPVTASAEQIEMFTSLYQGNFRPVQERNRRFVLYGN